MNKKILLIPIILISCFSCSSSSSTEKKTIGFKYYLYDNNTCSIAARKGFNLENVVIPNSIESNGVTYYVTSINSNQSETYDDICVDFLEGNKYVKSVTIESEGISTLPWDIFRNCSSLTYVNMEKATGIKYIGDHVFTGSPIEEIYLPPNLVQTYTGVFSQTNIKEITFPDTYVDMEIDTFFNCPLLEKVDLGSSITYISGSCFERTPKLKAVIGEAVTTLNQHCLRETTSLETVYFGDISYVGYKAFYKSGIKGISLTDCFLETMCFQESKLESVSLTDVESIPYKAFGDCTSLSNLILNGNISKIGSNAFKSTSIKSLKMPNFVTFIGSEAFYDCKNLEDITFSSTLESISTNAFKNCSSLTNISLPSSIKRIYQGAFLDTNIKEVTLPSSVTLTGECFPKDTIINYI